MAGSVFIVLGLLGKFFFGPFGVLHVIMGAGMLFALFIHGKREAS